MIIPHPILFWKTSSHFAFTISLDNNSVNGSVIQTVGEVLMDRARMIKDERSADARGPEPEAKTKAAVTV
jgi:hypothetical protein